MSFQSVVRIGAASTEIEMCWSVMRCILASRRKLNVIRMMRDVWMRCDR